MTTPSEEFAVPYDAIARHFSAYGEVNGIGLTRVGGKPAYAVRFVSLVDPAKPPPTEFEGVPVDCRVVGRVVALNAGEGSIDRC